MFSHNPSLLKFGLIWSVINLIDTSSAFYYLIENFNKRDIYETSYSYYNYFFSVFFNFGPGWASKTPDYVVARCIQFTFLNQLGQLKYVLENSNHQLYNKNLHLLTQISKEMELEDFSIKKNK